MIHDNRFVSHAMSAVLSDFYFTFDTVGRKQWTLDQMPPGDPMMREVMMRALNSGEPAFASRDENGKVTYHE